jgi:hypothetical protein
MVNVLPHGPSPWSSNVGSVLLASIYRQGKQAGDLPRHAGKEGTCSGSSTLPRVRPLPSSLKSSDERHVGVSLKQSGTRDVDALTCHWGRRRRGISQFRKRSRRGRLTGEAGEIIPYIGDRPRFTRPDKSARCRMVGTQGECGSVRDGGEELVDRSYRIRHGILRSKGYLRSKEYLRPSGISIHVTVRNTRPRQF